MFIRRKIKTLKGQSYEQHQLLKSVRTDRGPRQEVVLNMGSLDLPKQQWKDLANAIEEQLNNQAPFYFEEGCPEVEKLAVHFAQMIVSKSLNQAQEDLSYRCRNSYRREHRPVAKRKNLLRGHQSKTKSRPVALGSKRPEENTPQR